MQQAALLFIGEHDFRNFSTAKKSKNTTREVYDIDIYGDNEEMQILIQADDFLHNMARLMIGTLLDMGLDFERKKILRQFLTEKRQLEILVIRRDCIYRK